MPLASREKPGSEPGEGGIMAALEKIETHLSRNPDDGRGHDEVVAPIYMRLGRFNDAVRAYSAAARLLGSTADRQANLAEAMIYQGQGIVTAEARTALEAATAIDPKHIKARFFLALAAQQDGDRAKSVTLLKALKEDLPESPLKVEIGRQLVELGEAPGVARRSPPCRRRTSRQRSGRWSRDSPRGWRRRAAAPRNGRASFVP